jgi:hypothetical protein
MEGRGEDGGEAVERAGAAAGAGSARRRRSHETVIEPKDAVEGMTEEEAKRWRAFLKPKAGGGKIR